MLLHLRDFPLFTARLRHYVPRLALVAQLDRASASEAEGCGFDPRRAQLVKIAAKWLKKGFAAIADEAKRNEAKRPRPKSAMEIR